MKKTRRTITLPTQQEIDRLYKSGDINELRRINERLAKTANQRMAQLYKSNIRKTPALARAKYYVEQVSPIMTGGVFSRSKKIDPETLHEQISEELIFLRSSTSTVSGEKERRARKAFQTLTKGKLREDGGRDRPYLEIPEAVQIPSDWTGTRNQYFEEKFLSFLEADVWKDIKKYLYSTDTNLLQEAGEAIARGADVSDLTKAYRDYLEGETDIFTMWDDWTSIK